MAGFHSLPVINPKPNLSIVGMELESIMIIIAVTMTGISEAAAIKIVRNILSPVLFVCAKFLSVRS